MWSRKHSGLLGATVIVMAVSAACSGDTSTEQYFADLETVTGALDAELDDLEAGFNAGLLEIDFETVEAEADLIALFRRSLTGTADSFARLVAGLRMLEPPSEVAGPHDEALLAGERVLAAYQARQGRLEAISTLADIDEYAESFAATELRERFSESCRELQAIAARDGVDVDLGCS